MLSSGLDSGEILFHCLPRAIPGEYIFDFTMRSVKTAHVGLCHAISNGSIFETATNIQDKSLEVRYTRNADFSDEVAKEFLRGDLHVDTSKIKYPKLIKPFFS